MQRRSFIVATGAAAGIATGIHTGHGDVARQRLEEGFTFASISSDLNNLDQAARQHRLAGPGRAREEEVMAARRGELERAPPSCLPAHVGQIWSGSVDRRRRRLDPLGAKPPL